MGVGQWFFYQVLTDGHWVTEHEAQHRSEMNAIRDKLKAVGEDRIWRVIQIVEIDHANKD